MPIWRLIVEGVATLPELETTWSIDDVERANAVLDMREHYKTNAMKEAGKKK